MTMNAARHPLSVIFLLHIALEIPVAVQGLFWPLALPFMQMNNTAVVILKMYSAILFASCLLAYLCYPLPEFLPGKRAVAIAFCIYHTACSTILYQSPRFIPHTFGPAAEAIGATPETVWGTLHGIVGVGMVFWWQATVPMAAMVRQANAK